MELRQRLYSRFLDIDVFSDCVPTAAEAIAKLDETPYALVIADIGLPNGGIEHLVARIARFEPNRRPIVLVLAASAEAARSLDVEIVQIVLRRPVDIPQLVDMVQNCARSSLRRARPRREEGDGDSDPRADQRTS